MWLVNLALVYPVSQIENIGVFGILLPYYAGVLLGAGMLWHKLWTCQQDDATMQVLMNRGAGDHPEVVAKYERILPEWLSAVCSREEHVENGYVPFNGP